MARNIESTGRRLRTSPRTVLSAVAITGITATAVVVNAGTASAAVPQFPNNIVVFPDRDFVSVEGYSDPFYAGKEALVEVTRNGTVVGSARATISGTDVAFEVNHPGGVCWGAGTTHNVTPDIKPGDVVSLTLPDGLKDETTVADTFVTGSAVLTPDNPVTPATDVVVTVEGHVGPGVNTAQMEQRIINPDFKNTAVGRRDIRAVPNTVTVESGYDSILEFPAADTFKATYTFSDAAAAQLAVEAGGERAMSWQVEDAQANRQGLTIAEFGELGGPGMGGCPAGPSDQAAPAPGTATVVRSADKTSMSVKWTAATPQPGAEPVSGYSILAIEDTTNTEKSQVGMRTGADATSTTITGLDPAKGYSVEVRSIAGPRMSEAFTTSTSAPAPTDPTTGDTTPPTLSFDPAPNTDGTAVTATSVTVNTDGQAYYTTNGDPVFAAGLPSDGASPVDGPITISGPTTLKVASFDDAGNYTLLEGNYDSTAAPAPEPPAPPVAPTGLTATAGQASVTLRWDAVADPNVTGYQVTVSGPDGTPLASQPQETTARTQTVSGLTAGTTYSFTVKAMAGAVAGAESAAVTATPEVVTDQVTIASARWKTGEFRVTGTGSVAGARITLYNVNADGTIGTAIPNASTVVAAPVAPEVIGDWSIRLRNGAAPARNPGRIIAKSDKGGQTAPFNVQNG